MFTLFFAGKDFAPKCIIDGQNIQDWLQSHYIAAFGLLADRIRDAGDLLDECVIGWDSLNEPFEGLCGNLNLNDMATETTAALKKGPMTTPAQGLRLGMGQPQTVDSWRFGSMGPTKEGQVTIDPQGVTMWLKPSEEREDGVHEKWGWKRNPGWKLGTCIWAQHGVWDIQSGEITLPDYFGYVSGRRVVFIDDYWKTHWQAFSKRIRASHPESIMFVQPPVFVQPPNIDSDDLKGRCAYSAHYYDGLTLVSRHWNWYNADALGLLRGKYKSIVQAVRIGEWAIRRSLQEQIGVLKADAEIIGDYPTIIGEIGIPFDMDRKASYGWTDDGKHKGDYSNQEKALDASLNAADGSNAVNYTMWTYCPDNSHMWGDGWNMEDLSIWSSDDLKKKDEPTKMHAPSTSYLMADKISRVHSQVAPAASSISLHTLCSDSSTIEDTKAKQSITSLDRWDNMYDFLTDGARAVKAFCRPWPVAVIGVPKDFHFNISKAEFRMTVVVRSSDISSEQQLRQARRRLRSSSSPSLLSSASSESLNLQDDDWATEIYVPVVHYAHPRLVTRSHGQTNSAEDLGNSPIQGQQGRMFHSSSNSLGSSTTLITALPRSDALDILVEVTGGTWSVSGQVLKWWYPLPEGDETKEYTISIRRAGGAIKTQEDEERPSFCGQLFSNIWSALNCCVM
jgi:Glycoside hydrolase family 5 C-terminal domain